MKKNNKKHYFYKQDCCESKSSKVGLLVLDTSSLIGEEGEGEGDFITTKITTITPTSTTTTTTLNIILEQFSSPSSSPQLLQLPYHNHYNHHIDIE